MKPFFAFPLLLAASGCQSAPPIAVAPVAVAPTATPVSPTASAPVPVAPPAPTAPVQIVQSRRSSLPSGPRMMDDTPRPTFIPLPTPTPTAAPVVRPAPTPRENQTIIVSNAPIPGGQITPQVAASRDLVWADNRVMAYFRPGQRGYGGTTGGSYMTQDQAIARGYRVAVG